MLCAVQSLLIPHTKSDGQQQACYVTLLPRARQVAPPEGNAHPGWLHASVQGCDRSWMGAERLAMEFKDSYSTRGCHTGTLLSQIQLLPEIQLLAGDQSTAGPCCALGDASSAHHEVEQFYSNEGPLPAKHPSVSLWEKCEEPRGHRVIAVI